MCGICFCLYTDTEVSRSYFQALSDSILPYLVRRGPDRRGRKELCLKNDQRTVCLTLTSTILHLRGKMTPQPLIDEFGNILCWNGEIFGGIKVKKEENDTSVLMKILSSPKSDVTHSEHILSTMAKVQGPWSFVYWQATERKLWFGRDYFGRRSMLWHLPSNPDDVLAVTSVAERNCVANGTNLRFEEVPADGLYCLELSNHSREQDRSHPFSIGKFEWKETLENSQDSMFLTCPVAPFNRQMPDEQDLQTIEVNRKLFSPPNNIEVLRHTKENSVKERESYDRRVSGENGAVEEYIPEDGVVENLAENKVTCLKIAENKTKLENLGNEDTCCHSHFGQTLEECLSVSNVTLSSSHRSGTSTRSGDLNVVRDTFFQETNSTSRLDLDSKILEGCRVETVNNLWTPAKASERTSIPLVDSLSNSSVLREKSRFEDFRDLFVVVLEEAIKKRVLNLPRADNDISLPDSKETSTSMLAGSVSQEQTIITSLQGNKDARVGVLFSGGIDSMMITALADKFVPEGEAIDLINVAFEQKSQLNNSQKKKRRKEKMSEGGNASGTAKQTTMNFNVPDRLTGISGLEELQRLNPARRWNFIEVDVTVEELQEMRTRHISHLVSPLNSVLDDSIGCALWFAARGRGHLRASSLKAGIAVDEKTPYTSKAKVLLVGMGADEQLGGYSRHRTRFINEGWQGLMDEMEMEVKRISKRNLGRDDRCISDHGREARFPFLDEEVVSFLNALPVWMKTDPGLPRGTGEKLLLRQAARLLGLTSSSELPKRAIQFGSRIAKLESSGEKGSEACARLEC